MCGIVGIYSYSSRKTIDPHELRTIRDHMAPRGPDAAGSWISHDGRIGFGHRRLEIIGPGPQGAQPMVLDRCRRSPEQALVVTFNGEIYNHEELRRRLEAKGHVFESRCDTEVLLHLYEEHGDDLVDQLRGMYAFGLWDVGRERLLLARDPFGIKPLYYADDGETFWFASQARALLAGGAVDVTVDEGAVAGFLLLGSVPEPRTAWSAIRSVPAGSTAVGGG
ncbi:MAG: asparagine synthetase B family protein, partial [Acidimicrobiia bacterium]